VTANKDEKEYQKAKQLSTFPNYYDILGISKNATQKEIKNQYRQLVKKWHPDKSNEADAEKKMSKIIRAYEILSNKERKETYDKYFNAI